MTKFSLRIFLFAKDYPTMTSEWPGAPYFQKIWPGAGFNQNRRFRLKNVGGGYS